MAGDILWHVTMSMDGFIAGPNDAMDWAFEYGKPGPIAGEIIESTGAILAGRRGFDLGTTHESQGLARRTSSNLREFVSGAGPDDELKSRLRGLVLPRCLAA